jgi:hypothetical protein
MHQLPIVLLRRTLPLGFARKGCNGSLGVFRFSVRVSTLAFGWTQPAVQKKCYFRSCTTSLTLRTRDHLPIPTHKAVIGSGMILVGEVDQYDGIQVDPDQLPSTTQDFESRLEHSLQV